MRISVVMPVFEDREAVRARRGELERADEVIVVDASISDPVQRKDLPKGARLVSVSQPQRALQQNAGAELATGDVLLFLHADTEFGPDCWESVREACADGRVVGGGFDRRFDNPSQLLKWTCWLAGWRGRLFGWFLGDQVLFVKRQVFLEVGGFAEVRAFEEYDLCRRLKREGKMRCLRPAVISSGRRFEAGVLRRSAQDLFLTLRYWVLGTAPFR